MAKNRPLPHLVLSLLLLALCSIGGDAKQCPPCGSTSVPYPLSTGADCGDLSYKIRCANTTSGGLSLFFDALNGSSYPITSISPSSQRLVIRPAPFFSRSSCMTTDLSSLGVHLNSSLPFNVTSSNTIMLLNCTETLRLSPLNCSDASLCHTYADAAGSDAAACAPLPICCTFVAGGSSTSYDVRVSGTGCSAYRSFVNLNAGGTPVARWADSAGLELQWASPKEPLCRSQADCEGGSNVTCTADPAAGGALSRCFCFDGQGWDPFSGICVDVINETGSGSNHASLIAGLVSGLGAALLVSVAGFLLYRRQRRIREAREQLATERQEILNANNTSGRSAKNFTGREIKKATSNLSHDNLLGVGGYGEVYKGELADGTLVAVKCAKLGNVKSTEQVLNEVRILSQVNHRSLVRLLGCCVDLVQPIMVYEFIPNGARTAEGERGEADGGGGRGAHGRGEPRGARHHEGARLPRHQLLGGEAAESALHDRGDRGDRIHHEHIEGRS